MKKIRKNLASWAFLFPSIAGVLVFFLLPFIRVIYYSLIDNPINEEFVGLDNYKALFDNKAFMLAAKNTLTFSAFAVVLAVVLSLLLALLLEAKIPAKSKLRTFFLSPDFSRR